MDVSKIDIYSTDTHGYTELITEDNQIEMVDEDNKPVSVRGENFVHF